ncbi:MAG: hypothetical protein QOF74_3709 [Caballeronia mineralivorans]|jgi:hypothetical protein|nr:hypothetical protein [Caballeronia mineralivorans]
MWVRAVSRNVIEFPLPQLRQYDNSNTYLLIFVVIEVTVAILRRREAIGGWLFYCSFAPYASNGALVDVPAVKFLRKSSVYYPARLM